VLSAIATFVSSVTGKVALGVAVTAAGVGTAQAAHVVDLPGAPRASQEEVVVEETGSDELLVEDPDVTTTTVAEDPAPTDTEAPAIDETETDDPDAEDAVDTEDPNHGEVVSEFAHTTPLEGCERGQAIADLASGGRSSRVPSLDNCAKTDDTDDDEVADEDDESSETQVTDDTTPAKSAKGKSSSHRTR
jgi:hypothetical protein